MRTGIESLRKNAVKTTNVFSHLISFSGLLILLGGVLSCDGVRSDDAAYSNVQADANYTASAENKAKACAVKELARAVGFPNQHLDTLVCIANHESQYNGLAFNHMAFNPSTEDYGLFQINVNHITGAWRSTSSKPNCASLLQNGNYKNPKLNAKCAYEIYRERAAGGNPLTAWTTYNVLCHNSDNVKPLNNCESTNYRLTTIYQLAFGSDSGAGSGTPTPPPPSAGTPPVATPNPMQQIPPASNAPAGTCSCKKAEGCYLATSPHSNDLTQKKIAAGTNVRIKMQLGVWRKVESSFGDLWVHQAECY